MSEIAIEQDIITQGSIEDVSVEVALAINKQLEILSTDTPFDIRRKIQTLVYAIKKFIDTHNIGEINLPVEHTINNGIYIRQMYQPAGVLIVGKIYKQSHTFWLLKGTLLLVSEDTGKNVYCGPCIINFQAGTQKVGLALEDCIVATVHASQDKKDIAELEKDMYAETYAEVGKEDPEIDNSDLLMLYQNTKEDEKQ